MTDKQPEALRLADALQQQAVWEGHYGPSYLRDLLPEAAAELRRQHGEIESMRAERLRTERRLSEVEKQRDELLEALKKIAAFDTSDGDEEGLALMGQVRAVIARAEGKQ